MSKKTGRIAVAALAAGVVLGNVDRLTEHFSNDTKQQASNFDRNLWRKDPHTALQEKFNDDVLSFASTVKESLPSRDKALEQHNSISTHCDHFSKAVNYGTNHAFYKTSQERALLCLNTVEAAAVSTKTKYDTHFAEQANEYAKVQYPQGIQPPVFVPNK